MISTDAHSRTLRQIAFPAVPDARCSQDETFTTLVILPFRQPTDEQFTALADALCTNRTLRVIRKPSSTPLTHPSNHPSQPSGG